VRVKLRRRLVPALCVLLALGSLLSGCSKPAVRETVPGQVLRPTPEVEVPQAPVAVVVEPLRPSWITPVTDSNLAQLIERHRPNELGRVLILEYHHFGDEEGRWQRTWDNFRADLAMLYQRGYRAVNLVDYIEDRMPLPAGTSPVIFTFDDGITSQFRLVEREGQLIPDPQSAVGIMLDFAKQHPDFGVAGTFYVNFTPVPFGDEAHWQHQIQMLTDLGFEIANHSVYHDDLGSLSDEGVQETLAEQVRRIRTVLPSYDGSTLALPFGQMPTNESLAVSGEYNGVAYQHRAVLLVGSDPVYSLYDQRLDLMALPRVQAIESEFERWMDYMDEARYVSDGDPETVVVPENLVSNLNQAAIKGKSLRLYQTEQ
jgi:peptidoglycan/xylan/chitin deacetylase (PgdA/CDA1 family)